jgi:hypothetical protein
MLQTSFVPDADFLDRDLPGHSNRSVPDRPSRRLKICFISETLHAGVGRHIVDAILELARRGHEVHLVYSPARADPSFVAVLGGLPRVHCEAVRMPRAIGLDDISAFRASRRYVRSNGPFDIIHGHSSKGGGYARLLRLSVSAPVLYTPNAFATRSPGLSPIKRLAYRALELVFSQVTERNISR